MPKATRKTYSKMDPPARAVPKTAHETAVLQPAYNKTGKAYQTSDVMAMLDQSEADLDRGQLASTSTSSTTNLLSMTVIEDEFRPNIHSSPRHQNNFSPTTMPMVSNERLCMEQIPGVISSKLNFHTSENLNIQEINRFLQTPWFPKSNTQSHD